MQPQLSILTIGSEITDGRIQDTNACHLASLLTDNGFLVRTVASCRDDLDEIVNTLHFLSSASDALILSGGLGPTKDDLTREAVAKFSSRELVLDEDALTALKERYAQRKRTFDPVNERQVYFPKDACVLKNPIGTAPGFVLEISRTEGAPLPIYVLPGVPRELEIMTEQSVLPALKRHFPQACTPAVYSMRIFGLPESAIGTALENAELPDNLLISYQASFPEIKVQITAPDSSHLPQYAALARAAIGPDYVISDGFQRSLTLPPLEEVVHALLIGKKQTIAVAESCTSGMLGEFLTRTPGSSQYFLGGALVYSNKVKTDLLDVSQKLLQSEGAVSGPVAQAMAESVRKRFQSDLGISITGIAGPDGGTPDKPVGTFHIGIAIPQDSESHHFFRSFPTRAGVRRYAVFAALDTVRRKLLGLEMP